MFVEQPNPVPHEILEGTNYRMVDGKLRFFIQATGRSIPAAWVKCDYCGRVAPAQRYNKGKYCSLACTYKDGKGAKHWGYKGRTVTKNGYVRYVDPIHGGREVEHRRVMEQELGRKLETWEHVHHINGDRQDNRPENLEIWEVQSKRTHPSGVRKLDAIKRDIRELKPSQRRRLLEWMQNYKE